MTRLRLKDNKGVSKTKWLTCFLAKTEKILISRLFVVFETVYWNSINCKRMKFLLLLSDFSPQIMEKRGALNYYVRD